jgi:hypothetical protein
MRESIDRPLLDCAIASDEAALATALGEEKQKECLKDKDCWLPLKRELEKMRMSR